ncbi:MAG: hypothetical protein DI542_07575 [Acinetobacter johnsonii]|uniref:Beta-lactamase-related domain-containing protein n=1 Tax=Acinetobacter johnsonii TaxID=40214 RepID=A0A2W5RQ91_ACIJO|nr:MAG: hypothetical protein DI542_07575 [Acinetobacter johnsonii]
MKRSRFQLQKKDTIVLTLLITCIIGSVYVWVNYYQSIQRGWYILQKPFITKTIQCSSDAPSFMYQLMRQAVTQQKSMSNQLAYVSPQGSFYHCESGWEDGFRGKMGLTEDSRFIYASVSKIVTSMMVLDLINQNKIKLDQKLVDIIDIPPPKDERINKITVAMLLQHSAGFDRMKTYTPMLTMGKKPWCPTQIAYLSDVKLDFDPDTQYQYSNVGYCLLGAIVEKTTGLPFREAVEKKYNIGNRNIKFINSEFLADEIQYDYRNEVFYGDFWRRHFDFKESLSAVGGLSGSAKEITFLAKEMLKEKPLNLLSRSSHPCAINLQGGCYGLAMEPYQKQGKNFTVFNKSGYFPGVEADIFIDDKNGVLTFIRGATTPERKSLLQLRQDVYQHLFEFYNNDN